MTDTINAPRPKRGNRDPRPKTCSREGCNRRVRGDRIGCCFLCDVVIQELARAQRVCEATGDSTHWVAAVTLSDALTDYYRSDTRLYRAASAAGITDEQWRTIKYG